MSKTKNILSWIIVLFGIIGIIREYSYNFSRTKVLYSSFYPDKYFEKDGLIYKDQVRLDGTPSQNDIYYFHGILKKMVEKQQLWAIIIQ
ncbi:hypothetical protein HX109_05940 [Galbibacter sp. BG1]|uniref:hypothetical protein n=1 Tax=Galbibacter sp. BG1 TaxID=1170699 RepID=UPI0015BA4F4A|nr:hypothetical protein [Galbibacter sp. BG1]QLE01127.1 hypothetical protein HX109_05940 [Galbibacter sp. BG1]